MNEASEAGDTGGASAGESAASASTASDFSSRNIMGEDSSKAFKNAGLDFDKYGFDDDSSNEAPEEESNGIEETKEAGQATDENAYLKWINSLGAIHGDSPVKVESVEEVKNALQMFKDYTQKTQTLSEERKGWESEKVNAEREVNLAIQEFNTQRESFDKRLQELDQWTFTLNNLQENAPDLFEEVQRAYSSTAKQFSNPVLDQQLAAIRAELAETKKGLAQREDKLVVDGFESEYSAMSALEQSAKELGVTVSKDEIKKKWAATGLSAEEVFGAMYGASILKAQASKAKVAQVTAKTSAKPTGSAGGSRTGAKVKAIDPKLKAGSLSFASALWDRHTA